MSTQKYTYIETITAWRRAEGLTSSSASRTRPWKAARRREDKLFAQPNPSKTSANPQNKGIPMACRPKLTPIDFPVRGIDGLGDSKVAVTGRQECLPYVSVVMAAPTGARPLPYLLMPAFAGPSTGNNLHLNTPIRAKRNRSPVARHPSP